MGPYPGEDQASKIVEVTYGCEGQDFEISGWREIGMEIGSLVLDYSERNSDVDLYANLPLALAFIVGTVVGPVGNLTLCEYNIHTNRLVRALPLSDDQLQRLALA
jgi:hypothetical protein